MVWVEAKFQKIKEIRKEAVGIKDLSQKLVEKEKSMIGKMVKSGNVWRSLFRTACCEHDYEGEDRSEPGEEGALKMQAPSLVAQGLVRGNKRIQNSRHLGQINYFLLFPFGSYLHFGILILKKSHMVNYGLLAKSDLRLVFLQLLS